MVIRKKIITCHYAQRAYITWICLTLFLSYHQGKAIYPTVNHCYVQV